MRVYIASDTEGQACVTREKGSDGPYGTFQADYNRQRATAEASAAVEGARAAGATDIVVHDCGFVRDATPIGLTLDYDSLPRGIRIALGGVPLKQVAAEGFDAAFLIGHHAMAGTSGGVMAHTFSSATIRCMALNGREVGEIGIEALQLGAHGIPVVLVAADEAGCREATEWLGDVELASVKKGYGVHAALSMHPADACDLIRDRATRALGRLGDFRPFTLQGPFELQVECFTRDQAETRCERIGGTMLDGPRYVVRSSSPLNLFGTSAPTGRSA